MQKFLIIQTAFIGDVVLATAIVEKIFKFFPQSQIDIIVRKGNEKLLLNNPHINQTIIWDKKQNKIINLFKILKQIQKTKYDKVINLQRFFATGLLTALSGGKEKIGFDKNPLSIFFTRKVKHEVDKGIHEVQRNNKLIEHFTDTQFPKPKLFPSENDFELVLKFKAKPYITVTPSSVWFTKQYPLEKWIEFVNSVSPSLNIYLLGGPNNTDDTLNILSASVNTNVFSLAGELGFLQSAALMKDAIMNYANDSAPLHFASAMNAPITAIFCSTIPAFGFTPLSDISYIIQSHLHLTCKPCGLHGRNQCPLGHFKCALTIDNKELLNNISNE